jgi:hypothetical protein
MSEIPIRDRPISERIPLLKIRDRCCVKSIGCELPRIALEITREDFQFAEDTERAIVFPVGEFDSIGAAALVEWIDLLGKMLDMGLGLGQLNIHRISFLRRKRFCCRVQSGIRYLCASGLSRRIGFFV